MCLLWNLAYSNLLSGVSALKFLMSPTIYLAPGVEMVLLMWNLTVVRSAVLVRVSPSYDRQSPPTQRRTLTCLLCGIYRHRQCRSTLCLCLWELGLWWWILLYLSPLCLQNLELNVPTPYTFPFTRCLWGLGLLGVGSRSKLWPLCPLLHWPTIGHAVWGAVLKCELLFDLLPLKNIDGRVLLGACTWAQ